MRWSRVLLGFAGGLLALSLLALFIAGEQAHTKILELYYQVDAAGVRTERFDRNMGWSLPIARIHGDFSDLQLQLTGVALVALTLFVFALRRIDRKREVRLVAIASPLLAIVVTGLVIAGFGHYRYDDEMVHIHRMLSSVPAHFGSDGLCSSWIEPCSRMLVYDTMRTIAFVLASLAVLGLTWAGRLAWRAGERGYVLGRPGQALALGVFVLGLVALLSSRGHREAREQTRAACEVPATQWTNWAKRSPHWAVDEIEPLMVEACDFEPWTPLLSGEEGEYVGKLELLANGALLEFPRLSSLPADARAVEDETRRSLDELERELDIYERSYAGESGSPVPVVTLYVDARTPVTLLAERLRQLAMVGVHDVLVIGEFLDERELETVGPWRERALCPIAHLHVF